MENLSRTDFGLEGQRHIQKILSERMVTAGRITLGLGCFRFEAKFKANCTSLRPSKGRCPGSSQETEKFETNPAGTNTCLKQNNTGKPCNLNTPERLEDTDAQNCHH